MTEELDTGSIEVGELLWSYSFDSADEVLDGGLESFVWGWGRYGDGIVGHPLHSLSYAFSLGGDVPHSVAAVMTETWA